MKKYSIIAAFSVDGDRVKGLRELSAICIFLEVFLKDLRTMPPDREIEFQIELMLVTMPISKVPYWIALTELKELKE